MNGTVTTGAATGLFLAVLAGLVFALHTWTAHRIMKDGSLKALFVVLCVLLLYAIWTFLKWLALAY